MSMTVSNTLRQADYPADPTKLQDDPMVPDDIDEPRQPRLGAPPPGFAAGMALCIPALSVIGLLYAILK